MNDTILHVEKLRVAFDTDHGRVTAVNDLDFDLHKGETLCIVGESGSGKSVTALSIMGLLPKPAGMITGGRIEFAGEDLTKYTSRRMQEIRGNRISMIFQEPMTSLNPVYTVGYQISEVLIKHKHMKKREAMAYAAELLKKTGVPEPERRVRQYPHELSGGLRQRVMIAMALACEPDILIADEPTTALDVTIQAQILQLINALKDEFNMAVIFITHDMGVVSQIADRIIVMYGGMKMEEHDADSFFRRPRHPYTVSLLNCIPRMALDGVKLEPIPGMIPSLWNLPSGCRFSNRCSHATERCTQAMPPLRDVGGGHLVSCFLCDSAVEEDGHGQ
ncbi:MAG: ABC transporter ATP-binding protein [Aristaeellaceae bacterium]